MIQPTHNSGLSRYPIWRRLGMVRMELMPTTAKEVEMEPLAYKERMARRGRKDTTVLS
jgi:hypothetical protein